MCVCVCFVGGRIRKSLFITRQEAAAKEAEEEEELQEQRPR